MLLEPYPVPQGDRFGGPLFPLDENSIFSVHGHPGITNIVVSAQVSAQTIQIQWFLRAWFRARGRIRLDKYKGFGAYDF